LKEIQTHAQLELIPGPMMQLWCARTHRTRDQWALDTGLSPGAPVNNCRWASIPLVPENLKFSGPRVSSSKPQAASFKPQALDSWSRILYDAFRKREKNMITDKEYRILMTDVYRKIITAVNITTGDDGTKAHKVIETFSELWKMNKKEYEQQQKYFG